MNTPSRPMRRRFLAAGLGAATLVPLASFTPFTSLSFAAGSTPAATQRFVFVLLRGGMDGLSAVPAVGDPEFAAARGALAQFAAPVLALDNTFALHPQLGQ